MFLFFFLELTQRSIFCNRCSVFTVSINTKFTVFCILKAFYFVFFVFFLLGPSFARWKTEFRRWICFSETIFHIIFIFGILPDEPDAFSAKSKLNWLISLHSHYFRFREPHSLHFYFPEFHIHYFCSLEFHSPSFYFPKSHSLHFHSFQNHYPYPHCKLHWCCWFL